MGASGRGSGQAACVLALVFALLGTYVEFVCVIVAFRRGAAFAPLANDPAPAETSPTAGSSPLVEGSLPRYEIELPDFGFDLVRKLDMPELAEFWVAVGFLITMMRFLFSKMGTTILRRWFLLVGLLAILRGFSRLLTIRPTPPRNCGFEDHSDMSPWWVALLVLAGKESTCTNVLFTLHVVNLMLCALVWEQYIHTTTIEMGVSKYAQKCIVRAYLLVGYILIIATRANYTIDLFLWSIISYVLWCQYHYWIVLLRLDQHHLIGGDRLVSTSRISRWVLWFEKESPDLDFHPVGVNEKPRHGSLKHQAKLDKLLQFADSDEDDPEFDSAFPNNSNSSNSFATMTENTTLLDPKKHPPMRMKSSDSLGGYESFTPLD